MGVPERTRDLGGFLLCPVPLEHKERAEWRRDHPCRQHHKCLLSILTQGMSLRGVKKGVRRERSGGAPEEHLCKDLSHTHPAQRLILAAIFSHVKSDDESKRERDAPR